MQGSQPRHARSPLSHPLACLQLWELYHGTTAWENLLLKAPQLAAVVEAGVTSVSTPSLLPFDHCALPGYRELYRACVAEDPAARPAMKDVVVGGCAGRTGTSSCMLKLQAAYLLPIFGRTTCIHIFILRLRRGPTRMVLW